MREEDFCAELDAHLKYQLRVCRDCRGNVLKSFKELKPPAKRAEPQEPGRFEVCDGHFLTIAEGLVTVDCEEETPANFFLLAEEVEDGKVLTWLGPSSKCSLPVACGMAYARLSYGKRYATLWLA